MAIFEGAGVAIITPFNEDGSVNYDEFGKVIEDQISGGTDAIVVCGTTGESATMSEEEHMKVVKYCIDKVDHRIPVIAGTGSNATYTAVNLSKEAESYGADAVLCVTPYYNKATQAGLVKHYGSIAEAINIPIIVYNVPSRTGCNVKPETLKTLVDKYDNIKAVKDATGNLSQTADEAYECGDKLTIFSGNDDQIVPILSLGGKGVISVLSNVAPKAAHDIVAEYLKGNVDKSRELQLKYLPLIRALFCEVNPIPVKYAMSLLGYAAGPLRLPLCELSDDHKELIKREMKNVGLI
ncbi:MAG: 4-hydroxy-tetrahydrodipicolinate synthase [Lachnospiraceae bacterium]|nr:4-hydroxy-tetrahydrodipicolinate synthase [Lachnospiraceae bacterium]MEE3461017.1 4-hydroxy-tetrahydrodipicolinate synthase [Lachnospiraceae bacterium]